MQLYPNVKLKPFAVFGKRKSGGKPSKEGKPPFKPFNYFSNVAKYAACLNIPAIFASVALPL